MAFLLENDMDGPRLVQEANDHPFIRFMTTKKLTSSVPLRELPCTFGDPNPSGCVELGWSVSNNVSVSDDGKATQPMQATTTTADGKGRQRGERELSQATSPTSPTEGDHGLEGLHAFDDNWLYMSAVCYLYGRELHTAFGVPIGLMNTKYCPAPSPPPPPSALSPHPHEHQVLPRTTTTTTLSPPPSPS
jgi:sialate O-acetylesterase